MQWVSFTHSRLLITRCGDLDRDDVEWGSPNAYNNTQRVSLKISARPVLHRTLMRVHCDESARSEWPIYPWRRARRGSALSIPCQRACLNGSHGEKKSANRQSCVPRAAIKRYRPVHGIYVNTCPNRIRRDFFSDSYFGPPSSSSSSTRSRRFFFVIASIVRASEPRSLRYPREISFSLSLSLFFFISFYQSSVFLRDFFTVTTRTLACAGLEICLILIFTPTLYHAISAKYFFLIAQTL
jgi:hypothetical protein